MEILGEKLLTEMEKEMESINLGMRMGTSQAHQTFSEKNYQTGKYHTHFRFIGNCSLASTNHTFDCNQYGSYISILLFIE